MPSGSLWDFLDQMRCQGGRWTWERPNQIPHSDQSRSLFCCMMDSHVLIPPLSRALTPLPPGTSSLKRHIPNKDFPPHFWFTTTLMFDGYYRRLFIQQCLNSVGVSLFDLTWHLSQELLKNRFNRFNVIIFFAEFGMDVLACPVAWHDGRCRMNVRACFTLQCKVSSLNVLTKTKYVLMSQADWVVHLLVDGINILLVEKSKSVLIFQLI